MKNLFLYILLVSAFITKAQDTGSITGKLTDKEYNNEPLPFANVIIKGTTKGTTTDFDGAYEIANLEPGLYTIVFSYLGYESIEMANIEVLAAKATTVNAAMGASEGMALDEVVVKTTTRKDSETALLLDQKKAVEIKTSIGAQELAKKAVSNAADATTKVTGVNKKEGSSKIYVRGLGDRYNSTTLNGLPLPSNDPRNKNIDLSLFSTSIIKNVGIAKAFSSNISSDVAGANVDIVSNNAGASSVVTIGVSAGSNTQTTFQDFKQMDGANWTGINTDTKHSIRDLTQYNFEGNFTPTNTTAQPNLGLSLNLGKRFELSDESVISVALTGSFNNNYAFRDGFSKNIVDSGNIGTEFNTVTYDYAARKMLMANVGYLINANHKIDFNHLFVHSNTQRIEDFIGTTPDVGRDSDDNREVNLILQTEIQNRLFVNQIISTNKFGESLDVNASLGYNAIYNDEPNRRKNTFIVNNDTNTTRISQNAVRDNSRFYGNLFETDYAAKVDAIKYFGDRFENNGNIKTGYLGRLTNRKFDGIYFDHNFTNPRTTFVDPQNIDAVFNQSNLDANVFAIETSRGRNNNDAETFLPQLYDADKTVHAAYVDAIYNFNEKLTANVGLRAEDIKMNVTWDTNISFPGFSNNSSIDLDKTYILPSVNLKYELTEKINLRASSSLSYTYPQFKEIAPFTYEGINFQESGNPALAPSDNYNFEVKFELFPNADEVVAIGAFGKIIENSINRLERNSAIERDFTFDNSGDATVFGIEAETKLNVFDKEIDDEKNQNLSVGANATYMKTKLTYNTANTLFNYTGTSSQLEGASPFTLNANVSYTFNKNDQKTVSTLVFNYQSDKVFSIGTNFQENIIEKAAPMLDFVFSHNFSKTVTFKFNAKNLLNPSFERYRDIPEKLVMNSFKKGLTISTGISINL